MTMSLSPPPTARPVIFGSTSDYSNILFGKLQRAANLYGTNLKQPLAIVKEGDDVLTKKLEKCLWNQFYMANVGPDGVLEEADLIRPLSAWIPQADLKDCLIFFDLASSIVTPTKTDLFSGDFLSSLPLPFFNNNNKDKDKKDQMVIDKNKKDDQSASSKPIISINLNVLKCAVERQCAHIYVLTTTDNLATCRSTLMEYAGTIPSTILCLQEDVDMVSTKEWASKREQNMEGDFITSMQLQRIREDEKDDGDGYKNRRRGSTKITIPVEDVVEIMIQISLRTERDNLASSPKIVQLSRTNYENDENKNDLVEKPNSDYFTMMGGKTMKKLAGTVKTVTSWEKLLSPLGGKINTELCFRPDKPM